MQRFHKTKHTAYKKEFYIYFTYLRFSGERIVCSQWSLEEPDLDFMLSQKTNAVLNHSMYIARFQKL